jgi:hypothetical protein
VSQPDEDGPFIRPFLVTGGRTRPVTAMLRVDALITTLPAAHMARLTFEAKRVADVCKYPTSVAEVAATIGVPLGVARVLIADLIAGGMVVCGAAPELDVRSLERIRDLVDAL